MQLNINIHALGMPFNGDTLKTKSLGGSESAGYYLARELARRGHKVNVWTSEQSGGVFDGVTYTWCGNCTKDAPLGEHFDYYTTQTPHDVLIIQRHSLAFHKRYAAKVCIWQTHDLALHRTAGEIQSMMWQIDAVTCVSEFHRKQLLSVYGLNPDVVKVVPNGVDETLYAEDGESKISVDGDDLNLLFQSRPERGLDNALDVMDALAREGVKAHLYFCTYDNFPEHMRAFYEGLWQRAESMPNVTNLGSLTKSELALFQKQCDLLFYPTEFEEVSCITAMEAMHAGLPMLASAHAALPETCGDGAILVALKDGKADLDKFAELISMYAADKISASNVYASDGTTGERIICPSLLDFLKEKQRARASKFTWAKACDALEDVIHECFKKPSPGAVAHYAIEHADIKFFDWYSRQHESTNAIHAATVGEFASLYGFATNPEKLKAHYDEHQGKYYDTFDPVGEDVTRTTRFIGTLQMLAACANEAQGKPLHVLDYGCAHGHYIVPLAKVFPNFEFVGVDISERAIANAKRWVAKEGLTNVTFLNDSQSILNEYERGHFDVVIAGEVVEHVWDYRALLQQFVRLVGDEGHIITTTPYGRWEWTGHEAFREAREHLHHFEREDFYDIWRALPRDAVEIVTAPAGHDETGAPLGSYCVRVKPQDCEVGEVDYERKLRWLQPRQTISACLIVKDGEKTLRRTLDSLALWADEIVIGVDPATKDRTDLIIGQFDADQRWKSVRAFTLSDKVLDIGFGPARNETVAKASGDWILWCDSDEELQNGATLWKLARSSGNEAFGIGQVHYSTNPPQVLTTDYPCRLFRNHGKIKFYGLVHEHPETKMGSAIPYTAIRNDAQFLHSGYVDERARRTRFHRNLPLLMRDVKENPERFINKFLLLRDIAQGIQFEMEQTGGRLLSDHAERAQRGVDVFVELMESKHLRLIVDSLQYYSHCVAILGKGFEAKVGYSVRNEHAPTLAMSTEIQARFYNREHFEKLLGKLIEESTKHYGSQYL